MTEGLDRSDGFAQIEAYVGKLEGSEFEYCRELEKRSDIAQMFAVVIASIAAVPLPNPLPYYGSILAVLAAVAWRYVENQKTHHRALAERARRMRWILNGLGTVPVTSELRDLIIRFHHLNLPMLPPDLATAPNDVALSGSASTGTNEIAQRERPYHDSIYDWGQERLAEVLEQSAFFTKALMQESERIVAFRCAVYVLLILVSVASILPLGGSFTDFHIGQIALTIVALAIGGEYAGRIVAFRRAVVFLEAVETRLENVRRAGNPLADLLIVALDYNVVLERAPQALGPLYDKHKDRLNGVWEHELELRKRRHPQPSQSMNTSPPDAGGSGEA